MKDNGKLKLASRSRGILAAVSYGFVSIATNFVIKSAMVKDPSFTRSPLTYSPLVSCMDT